jgi:predicted metalloprotease with PDZ domain
VSYYAKGRAIGLFLDLAILGQTGGKKSLDDVMRQLYKECKPPKPGYKAERIRELCVQFGGEKLGPWYDKVVVTADPMPWDEVLPTVGLKLEGRALLPDDSGKDALTNWP